MATSTSLLFLLSPPISGKTIFRVFCLLIQSNYFLCHFTLFFFILAGGWINPGRSCVVFELCFMGFFFSRLGRFYSTTSSKRKPSARFCFRFRQFDVIFAGNLDPEQCQWKIYIEKAVWGGIHTMGVVYLLPVKTYIKLNICFIEIVT